MNRWIAIVTLCLVASSGHTWAGELRVPRKAAAEIERDLSSATKVELLSLDGGEPDGAMSKGGPRVLFHDYAVLGTLDITGIAERTAIVQGITRAIGRSPLRMFACFFPRHGIRAALGGGRTLELLICFECSTVYRYKDGKEDQLNIDEKPQAFLNEVLRKAGVAQAYESPVSLVSTGIE